MADHDLVFWRCRNKEPHSSEFLCRVVLSGTKKLHMLQIRSPYVAHMQPICGPYVSAAVVIADATSLVYFRQGAPTKLITDASPVGLGAVLVQTQDGTDRALCYDSRTLSYVERRCSKVEKEPLAVVWACERFDLYLFGLPKFQQITDNKAVQFLFSSRSKPSARIEWWVLRLVNDQYEVVHVPSAKTLPIRSPAYLASVEQRRQSRMKMTSTSAQSLMQHAVPAALSVQDIEDASADDEDLQVVRSCLKSGNWNDCPRDYVAVRHELTKIGKLVLRGTRLVIPAVLRADVLELVHEGHQGIVKTKQRLQSKAWWPGMDNAAERKCRTCHGCQLVGQPSRPPRHCLQDRGRSSQLI